MEYRFRWNAWNREKVQRHNVSPEEAQYVIRHARRPFPMRVERQKRIVWGQTAAGEYLQVIYLLENDDEVYIIHARPLAHGEKKRLRRRWR
jgi:uncharacterized DUF497 family protein